MVSVRRTRSSRIRQGDIVRDLAFIEYVAEKSGVIEVSQITFPLAVVLSQDCDLEQDYNSRWKKPAAASQDKWLLSVLVAPLYNVEQVYLGEHLTEIGLSMRTINKKRTEGRYLRNNEIPRYHYVEFPDVVNIVPSVIDFKHYFSVNGQYLRKIHKSQFVCNISPLYREDISQRFAAFLGRIGLP